MDTSSQLPHMASLTGCLSEPTDEVIELSMKDISEQHMLTYMQVAMMKMSLQKHLAGLSHLIEAAFAFGLESATHHKLKCQSIFNIIPKHYMDLLT